MDLPDVNVWLALTFESHRHHPEAARWFNGLTAEGCSFCRLTQQGFLRLATNPAAFREEAVTLKQAWELYGRFIKDERVIFSDEPPEAERHWRRFTSEESWSPKVWSDAWIAACALAGGLRVITFDQAFTRYRGVPLNILKG